MLQERSVHLDEEDDSLFNAGEPAFITPRQTLVKIGTEVPRLDIKEHRCLSTKIQDALKCFREKESVEWAPIRGCCSSRIAAYVVHIIGGFLSADWCIPVDYPRASS